MKKSAMAVAVFYGKESATHFLQEFSRGGDVPRGEERPPQNLPRVRKNMGG